jgi:hypothetical protein
LADGSTGSEIGPNDPLKERTVDERTLSAKVRRNETLRELTEDLSTERKPRRTGVCLADGSPVFEIGPNDPLKERTVDERRLSAKVRRN